MRGSTKRKAFQFLVLAASNSRGSESCLSSSQGESEYREVPATGRTVCLQSTRRLPGQKSPLVAVGQVLRPGSAWKRSWHWFWQGRRTKAIRIPDGTFPCMELRLGDGLKMHGERDPRSKAAGSFKATNAPEVRTLLRGDMLGQPIWEQ